MKKKPVVAYAISILECKRANNFVERRGMAEKMKDSGCSLETTIAGFDDFYIQLGDAIEILKREGRVK